MKNNLEYITFNDKETELFDYIDNYFYNIALQKNGLQYNIPAMIDKKTLQRCGYFKSFPQHITSVATVKEEYYTDMANGKEVTTSVFEGHEKYLTPAACLHIYPMLENKDINKPLVLTTRARVYRYEHQGFNGNTRLWDFTVREIVFVGSKDYVLYNLDEMKRIAVEFAESIELNVRIQSAIDPFFTTKENVIRQKIQKRNAQKYELIGDVNGINVALGSFNFHGMHFSNSFNFKGSNNFVSGCVGFGLERWIAAIKAQKIDVDNLLNNMGDAR